MDFETLVRNIHSLDANLRQRVAGAANTSLTARNWLIGAWVVAFEQRGADRAAYGERLIPALSKRLGIKGLGSSVIWSSRQFFLTYPEILQTLSGELSLDAPNSSIFQTLSGDSYQQATTTVIVETVAQRPSSRPDFAPKPDLLLNRLSFSHFVELIKLDDALQRTFYEIEAIRGAWSVRTLKRQIGSLLFERSGLSTDKDKLARLARENCEKFEPSDIIRDPYIFEFLGLQPAEAMRESDLETALLDHLREFLLELGHGFCFEARQKKIRIGTTDYFIDLVFYHRRLKCHVLIELKTEPFNHGNAGQLNTYLNYYRKHEMESADRPPVGLLLCTGKDHALAEYALGGMDENLFVSTYRVALPDKTDLEAFLRSEARQLGL